MLGKQSLVWGYGRQVDNTDGEGRLTLADALWFAQEKCGVQAVINIATLTGMARQFLLHMLYAPKPVAAPVQYHACMLPLILMHLSDDPCMHAMSHACMQAMMHACLP